MIGGSDTAHILGAIGGAVVGGIAGNAAQEGLSSQSGYEYVIQLDNGSMVTVSQGNDVLLNPGQKCMVLYGKRPRCSLLRKLNFSKALFSEGFIFKPHQPR